MKIFLLFLLIFVLATESSFCKNSFEDFLSAFANDSLVVQTPVGDIEGIKEMTDSGDSYVAFRGIPYAKPPVGKLRFAKPEPTILGGGLYKAHNDPKSCPQVNPTNTSEDCLYLNIFIKNLEQSAELRKVFVYIHGGGFAYGSASGSKPYSLVTKHDIIVVTINYRLGLLGFLTTKNDVSPGNYGLWDQALALKWIKHNIRSFGGDENDVTIAGESAGAISTTYLSVSPVGKDLFTKVHAQSGTATGTSTEARNSSPIQDTLELAKSYNCWNGKTTLASLTIAQSKSIIKCLRAADLNKTITQPGISPFATFNVVIDGVLLPQLPSTLLKDHKYLKEIGFYNRSYLIGFNNNERANTDVLFQSLASSSNMTKSEVTGLSNLVLRRHVNARLGQPKNETFFASIVSNWYSRRITTMPMVDVMTDLLFTIPSFDFANALSRCNKGNVWLLYFNHYPAFMKGPYRGTPHELDLNYWQDLPPYQFPGIQGWFQPDDFHVKDMFQSVIASLVKTGNPSSSKLKLANDWPKYSKQGGEYLDFNVRPSVRSHLKQDKTDFWLSYFPKYVKSHLAKSA